MKRHGFTLVELLVVIAIMIRLPDKIINGAEIEF
jgi:competence protein ComGC